MIEDVVVEMMGRDFLLWRCLHGGPLNRQTIDQPRPHPACPWPEFRARNIPLLEKLTATYGACAVVARDGDRIVGMLRFYPKAICSLAEPGPGLCMQQKHPAGPSDDLVRRRFPPLEGMADKTLRIHCLMTGSPQQEQNPYQRKGLGKAMVLHLIEWARRTGWRAVEAAAYEDLDLIYAITGQAGKAFWEKLGFHIAEVGPEPALEQEDEFVKALRQQAASRGLDPAAAASRYLMRFELA